MADEKNDEKENEKREEKSPEEKWRRDPLSSLVWAGIIIWAGLVLLAENLGILGSLGRNTTSLPVIGRLEAWSLIFLGAGVIILLEVVARLTMPAYRRPVGGSLILGVIFIGIGLGDLFNWNIVWPLVLIALGVMVLFRGFLRR